MARYPRESECNSMGGRAFLCFLPIIRCDWIFWKKSVHKNWHLASALQKWSLSLLFSFQMFDFGPCQALLLFEVHINLTKDSQLVLSGWHWAYNNFFLFLTTVVLYVFPCFITRKPHFIFFFRAMVIKVHTTKSPSFRFLVVKNEEYLYCLDRITSRTLNFIVSSEWKV
jgi:hypothetical protein